MSIDDWLEINWEMFIERELLQGNGYVTEFSVIHLNRKILNPNNLPNFTVIAKSKNPSNALFDVRFQTELPNNKLLRLFSFRTFKNNAFGLYPPFDLAELVVDDTNELFTIPIDELNFYLEPLSLKYV